MPGAERLGDLTPGRSMNRRGELAKELLHGFIFGKTFESGPALGVGLGSASLQSSFRVVRTRTTSCRAEDAQGRVRNVYTNFGQRS